MKTIVWDVDDVLNDLLQEWFVKSWLSVHDECMLHYSEIRENPPHNLLGVNREEYLESLDMFRQTSFASLAPVPEMINWFQKNGTFFYHIALTSVPLKYADLSASWVMRHFGVWIRSFNIVPSPRDKNLPPQYDRSKRDFLSRWPKVDIFIDDSAENVKEALDLGISAVLFPRPWNGSTRTLSELLDAITK